MNNSTQSPNVEQWRTLPDYEGRYEASSLGRIRRVGKGRGSQSGRVRTLTNHVQGYLATTLYKNNAAKTFLVHRLIATAFIRVLKDGEEVNHINGDKRDNRLVNLEIVTRQQNVDHAINTGLANYSGENNPQAKLTTEQVAEIRVKYIPGKRGYKALAKEYKVSWEAIRNIIKRKVWKS